MTRNNLCIIIFFGKKGVVSICIANVAQSVSTGKPGLCSSVLVLTRLLPFLWQKSVFYFNTKGEFYGALLLRTSVLQEFANELFPLLLFIGIGAIMVAAYSYMALVPIVQPPVIKAVTTKKERQIRMKYSAGEVSKTTKILFPIVVTVIAGLVAPKSVALVGFLMFGNLIRECGVLNNLSETAQNSFANIITILLGITVAGRMNYKSFVQWDTILILALGLVAFVFDTIGGVMFAKFLNLFLPKDKKINPMIGAAGISAFPMSGRVVNQMGLKEDNQNFLLMQSISVNVSGQIASVIAGGLILTLVS